MEFVALANHRKAIRAEIAASAERFRAEQLAGLEACARARRDRRRAIPADRLAVLMTSISPFLVIERETLGMSTGHAETVAFVEELLTRFEGPRSARATRSARGS